MKQEYFNNRINPNVFLYLTVQIVFLVGIFHSIHLPGLYFDEAGSDYLAARFVNPQLDNPIWIFPTTGIPLLGTLYGGVPLAYIDIPFFLIFGTNIISVRFSHAVIGMFVLFTLQLLLKKITKSNALSFVLTLILSTLTVFAMSFRSLAMACMVGLPFLVFSLHVLIDEDFRISEKKTKVFLSGILLGFASYTYFVYFLFLPITLLMIYFAKKGLSVFRTFLVGWITGFIPYLIGIYMLFLYQGSLRGGIDWIKWALSLNKPLSDTLLSFSRITNGFKELALGILNVQPEKLVFGRGLIPELLAQKIGITILLGFAVLTFTTILLPLLLSTKERIYSYQVKIRNVFMILPLLFVAGLSLLFGQRLAVWHILPAVPLMFLSIGISINQLAKYISPMQKRRFIHPLSGIAVSLILVLNFTQQQIYFKELNRSGGVGMNSSALNDLAFEAAAKDQNAVYFLPDWGFWTSFATLTGNKVKYELNVTPELISSYLGSGRNIRIVFWSKLDEPKYLKLLQDNSGDSYETNVREVRDKLGGYAFTSIELEKVN